PGQAEDRRRGHEDEREAQSARRPEQGQREQGGGARADSDEEGLVPAEGVAGRSPSEQRLADAREAERQQDRQEGFEPWDSHGASSPNQTRSARAGRGPRSSWWRNPGSVGGSPIEIAYATAYRLRSRRIASSFGSGRYRTITTSFG